MQVESLQVCPLCGKSRFRPYKRIDEWQIVQCVGCKLAFLNPRPNAAEQEKVYKTYYGYPPMPSDPIEKRRLIDQERYRVEPMSRAKSPGTLLDVGCGAGMFMALAQEHGWTVYGTEISPHCITYAREELGLEVYQGDLVDLDLKQRFDVVALNHVLEHVSDPVALVRAAKMQLRDDGLLYVGVPNHHCSDARRQGGNWEGWALPWHFYHYTPVTLRRLLERCGFRVMRYEFGLSREFNRWPVVLLRKFIPQKQRHVFSGTNLTAYAYIDDISVES